MKKVAAAWAFCLLPILGGCGGNSMQDITTKAEKAKTKEQLEAALGKPDKFEAVKVLVPLESWTYTATDGEVNFTIVDGKVKTTVAIPKKKKTE